MKSKRFFLFIKFFVAWLVVGLLIWWVTCYLSISTNRQQANVVANNVMNQMSLALNDKIDKIKTLGTFVVASGEENMQSMVQVGDGSVFLDEFNLMAEQLRDCDSIRALQLLPNGVVLYTYPYESNKDAIGDDVLHRETRKEDAIRAMESGELIVSGPLELLQGGQALIARNPIYYEDGRFWGFSALVLDMPDVLQTMGIDLLQSHEYLYHLVLTQADKQTVIASNLSDGQQLSSPISACKTIFDGQWCLYVTPSGGWYSLAGVLFGVFIITCLAFLLAFFMSKNIILLDQTKQALKKEHAARLAAVQAYEAADIANAAKSTFLSTMSHDIRTPMNAIVGLCTLLERDADNKERVREHTQRISASSQHLLGLINDILDMSKIESGRTNLNLQDFQLARVVDEINTIIGSRVSERHQRFDIIVSDVRHELLVGDKLRLNQILINLLSNAVKYTHEYGCITFEVKELSQRSPHIAEFQFIVTDNGIGMSQEFMSHIYEPFARATDGRVDKVEGTGLGMAITKNLIDLMGGTIEVQSELGQGTTFTVGLSFRIQESDSSYEFFAQHNISHVLLVDDDPCSHTCIQAAMAGTGVDIQYASNKVAAVEMLCDAEQRGCPFHLILLDWKLSAEDGVQVAKTIRCELKNNTPIFLLTAFDWSEIEQEAIACGINGFLAKPFFLSNFKYAIEYLHANTKHICCQRSALEGLHILAAEDNDLNAEILCELLSMQGAVCEICSDGKQISERFQASDPDEFDLILMDIQMPIMNGLDATKAIRNSSHPHAKSIPIIAMTANAFAEDVKSSRDAGMNAHISKPVDMDLLENTVKTLLHL